MPHHFNQSIFYLLLLASSLVQGSNLTTAQQLLEASQEGDLVTINELVKAKKVDINSKDLETGNTALHYACQKEDKETIRYLLACNAQFNIPNKKSETALSYIKKYNCSKDITELFIKKGASFDKKPPSNTEPSTPILKKTVPQEFFDAAKTGDLNKLKYYIENQGVNSNSQDSYRNTVLHYACEKNHELIIHYLINKKATLNIPGFNGNQALYNVCRYGSLATFNRFTSSKTIDFSHIDPYFYAAIQGDNLEILLHLFQNYEIESDYLPSFYCYAINTGALKIVKYFIEERQINKNTLFTTKLSAATKYTSLFFYLLIKGKPFKQEDTDYLSLAIYNRQWPLALYLIKKKYPSRYPTENLISDALEQSKKLEQENPQESVFDQAFPLIRALIQYATKTINIFKIHHRKKLVLALMPLTKKAQQTPKLFLSDLSCFLSALCNKYTFPIKINDLSPLAENYTKTPEEIWVLTNWLPHTIKVSSLLSHERKIEQRCTKELSWYNNMWKDERLHATQAFYYFKNLQTLAKKAVNKQTKNSKNDLVIYFD
ncbi:TPA: hypothetical protein DEG75_04110 [Candidatus Dependentiae bacterium]|nr:hypothetical protein [Candidatus Dependentiae bacterium]